jgi:hypothetical protein
MFDREAIETCQSVEFVERREETKQAPQPVVQQ